MKNTPGILFVCALAACSESVSIRPENCMDTRTCDTGAVPTDAALDSADGSPRDSSVTPTADAPPDRPVIDGGPPGEARTYDYVVTGLTIDTDESAMSAARGFTGFNLDGRYSDLSTFDPADCRHADFYSTLDPDQNMGMCLPGLTRGGPSCRGGVDNQLPAVAATVESVAGMDVRDNIRTLVTGGSLSILVRVEGVNGVPGPTFSDPEVRVMVYNTAFPTFPNCSDIGTPGQTYAIADGSLTTPGDLSAARVRFTGHILNGRLYVDPPTSATPNFSIPIPLGSSAAQVDLYRTQLRFDMTPDRGANGNLGGYARLTDLVPIVQAVAPLPPVLLGSLLTGFVDVQEPAGDDMGCGQRRDSNGLPASGAVGMGMGFTAVRAVIAPTTVTSRPSGACGG
jgi:hypothetical protein